jgi:Uma2 family endonuclease
MNIRQFQELPKDPHYLMELVAGQLVREPRPRSRHGWIVMRLGHFLMEHVEPRRAGYVMTETGVVLSEEPATVRGPDLCFVAAERLPGYPNDDYLRVAPDLVAEVLSPSDSRAAMAAKVVEYLLGGVMVVLVVDPRARTVAVHRAGRQPERLHGDDVLTCDDVLPGFQLPLPRLFG